MEDVLGNDVTAASAQALRAYERAVDAHLHAWPGVTQALDEALAEDPDFVLAYALRALWMQMYGRIDEARAALGRAEAGAAATSAREQSHVALVSAIVGGRAPAALVLVQQHAQRFPTDVLSASTAMGAYGLFAFSGRRDHDAARRAFIEALAPQLPAELPWLLMHRAWVRIEDGAADEGLDLASRSMAARPQNGHGAHVLLHGLYETQRAQEALDFLAAWLPAYPDDALMWGHLQWHGALAELALGDQAAATRRLLGPVMDFLPKGPPFMGLPDTASLLWRLGLHGASALPWPAAQRHAERLLRARQQRVRRSASGASGRRRLRRRRAVGRVGQARADGAPRPRRSACRRGFRSGAAGDATRRRAEAGAHWPQCLPELPRIGGSHAQRSVVELTHAAGRLATSDRLA